MNDTSWLMVGLVGENVKRATVGTVLGKSSAVNATEVGVSLDSVTLFSEESAPVLVSLAVNVTSRLRRRRRAVEEDVGVGLRQFEAE